MNTALNRTSIAMLTNKSGGSVAQGDVVIVDSANASAFTTTTTSSYAGGSIGVVMEPNGIASNALGSVAFGGYVPLVNLSSSASLGDLFHAHSVAKQALRHAAPIVGGDFGQVLGTGTTPAAFLWGQPAAAAGAGSTTFAGDTDVSLSGLANLDQIQYQTGDSKFHNVKGGMVCLVDTTVTGSVAASISLPSISSSYRSLLLVLDGRGDVAAAATGVGLRFNGDTGANYDDQQMFGTVTTLTATQDLAGTSIAIGAIPGATATANLSNSIEARFPNYSGTTFQKNVIAQLTDKRDNAGNTFVVTKAGWWRSTAAISSITLTPSSGNFVIGTRAMLYGY